MGTYYASAVRLTGKNVDVTRQPVWGFLWNLVHGDHKVPPPEELRIPHNPHLSVEWKDLVRDVCAYLNWNVSTFQISTNGDAVAVLAGTHKYYDIDDHLVMLNLIKPYINVVAGDVLAHLVYESADTSEMIVVGYDLKLHVRKSGLQFVASKDWIGEDPRHPYCSDASLFRSEQPHAVEPNLPWTLDEVLAANEEHSAARAEFIERSQRVFNSGVDIYEIDPS